MEKDYLIGTISMAKRGQTVAIVILTTSEAANGAISSSVQQLTSVTPVPIGKANAFCTVGYLCFRSRYSDLA